MKRNIVTAIETWNAKLSILDRQTKYRTMVISPLTFYRGSNHLFWQDFANDTRISQFGTNKTITWISGDLHIRNYGAYDDDIGTVVYELNDFDESVIADYQYDVWRMTVSLVLLARENGDLNIAQQRDVVDAFSESYLDTLAAVNGNKDETRTSFTADNTYGLLDDFLKSKQGNASRKKMLDSWAPVTSGRRQFDLSNTKLAAVDTAMRDAIIDAMPGYGNTLGGGLNYSTSYFRVKDVAKRLLAGVGSFGIPRYYVLIEGASSDNDDDRILDVKRQSYPTPYFFLGRTFQKNYDARFIDNAARHAIAYNALTRHTDDHLGWMQLSDASYSVRERSPYKETINTKALNTDVRFTKLTKQWASVLAMAHARSDKDAEHNIVPYSLDKQVVNATNGSHSEFRRLVRDIAFSYADQVEADWRSFVKAYGST